MEESVIYVYQAVMKADIHVFDASSLVWLPPPLRTESVTDHMAGAATFLLMKSECTILRTEIFWIIKYKSQQPNRW